MRWCLAAPLVVWLALLSAGAQETAESRAFKTAARWYQTGIYDTAEREFQRFAAQFPQSPMLSEAVLFQARSALEQTNAARAISILNTQMPKAGLLTDQYRYWLGRAHILSGNYQAAAESYALVLRQFQNSGLLLEASYGEALARFKMRDFDRVVALLQDPNGAFQQAIKVRSSDRFAISGVLLLAEALFELRQYRAAEEAARQLVEKSLGTEYPEYAWDRQYLLCRVYVATQRLGEALSQTTNLIATARVADSRSLQADSVALQAGILQQLDRVDEAVQTYTNNLAETVPADRRRLALLNIIELKLAQDKTAEAGQMLQDFLLLRPEDSASDVVLLTTGEFHLKQHFQGLSGKGTNAGANVAVTNQLNLALTQFEKIGTNSPLRGKALLNKGWGLWLDQRIAESVPVFRAAAAALPFSEDLAVARFKLADGLYYQGDYTNAISLYRSITNDFVGVPRVRESLFDQALYQIVRASIQVGDVAVASGTMNQLLDLYPESSFSERSLWLVGQELIQVREPSRARQVFNEFVKRFPDRALLPKIELAIARTFFHEGDFTSAISHYDEWLARYPTNELSYRAEFNRAWANAKAGRPTNAFNLFTNFVAQFPTNELARDAQYWIADEFWRQGNYFDAQKSYQSIVESTNWVRTNVTYQAWMMAGRAAFAAQRWNDAEGHFTGLVNDTEHCPVDIAAEAFFALGDTILSHDSNAARPLEKFETARTAFEKITQLPLFATNRLAGRLVPLAWGRIGDCSLQLASQDPKQFENATNAYRQAMTHPAADLATRTLAEYGLAYALETRAADKDTLPADKTALLKAAMERYANIVLGGNLSGDETMDPIWVEKAGLAAARLAESQLQWSAAIKIYERMHDVLEPLRPRLRDKINKATEQLRNEKN